MIPRPKLPSRRPAPRHRRTGEPGRPTILDVAERAGVSLGTVSNVLNGRARVSGGREARVRGAIAELGFVPNGFAQGLRNRRSRVVGICVPLTSSAYFASLLDAFEQLAARQGYELMQVLSRQDSALELRRIQALLSRNIDGLILIPTSAPARSFDAIADAKAAAVVVDRVSDDQRFDYVTIDDYETMAEATRTLIDLGHRRLRFVVRHPTLVTTRRRIEGFREAAAARAGVRAEILVQDPDPERFRAQIAAAMQGRARPSAIIVSNSDLALALLHALKPLGVRIPDELSLLVFDNPPWAGVLTPSLSVVRPPVDAMARAAWELLLRRMEHDPAPRERLTLHAELVLRESVRSRGRQR